MNKLNKILIGLLLVLTGAFTTYVVQDMTVYGTDGWDAPYGKVSDGIRPSYADSGGYYDIYLFELLSNPGGWLNRNFWVFDSLFEASVVYTDTKEMIIDTDTLRWIERFTNSTFSNPPDSSEISDLIGTPDSLGAGYYWFLKEDGTDTLYQVVSDSVDWWIFKGVKAL